jgi:hypothetical protein
VGNFILKENLSATSLNKIIYQIFKFLPAESTDLFLNMTKIFLYTRKCPMSWKEGKAVLLPNPVQNEEEKMNSENWKPITLTNTMY